MSGSVDDNPWRNIPEVRPYILPEDEPHVRAFNQRVGPTSAWFVQFDELIPEAFMGNRNAPVVLLSNNPGIGKGRSIANRIAYAGEMRKNLLHEPADCPFPFLAPDFNGRWWHSKLKELIQEFDQQTIARSVFNVVYFPYASRRFGHGKLALPSQRYSFRLVEEAVKRKAVIVRMRRGERIRRLWVAAVPKLETYSRFYRVNSQNAAVSRRNCDNFEEVVRAIRVSLP